MGAYLLTTKLSNLRALTLTVEKSVLYDQHPRARVVRRIATDPPKREGRKIITPFNNREDVYSLNDRDLFTR